MIALEAVLVAALVGTTIPAVEFIDDTGRSRRSTEWKGTPTVLVPIYTSCPNACLISSAAVKKATFESRAGAGDYRVVLFSFDSNDTPADLRAFRERQRVPLSWTLATARPDQVRRLMDAIGFRYAQAGGQFAHPTIAVVLTAELKTAKVLAGTNLDGAKLDDALRVAGGGRDWIGDYGGWALALLLLTCSISAMYMVGVTSSIANLLPW